MCRELWLLRGGGLRRGDQPGRDADVPQGERQALEYSNREQQANQINLLFEFLFPPLSWDTRSFGWSFDCLVTVFMLMDS